MREDLYIGWLVDVFPLEVDPFGESRVSTHLVPLLSTLECLPFWSTDPKVYYNFLEAL